LKAIAGYIAFSFFLLKLIGPKSDFVLNHVLGQQDVVSNRITGETGTKSQDLTPVFN
jgi:hypothetical protein